MRDPSTPTIAVKVLAAGGMSAVTRGLAPHFEHLRGHKLEYEFATAGAVNTRIADGEVVDVAIATSEAIDRLAVHRKLVAETATHIAHVGIGVAIRAGAPKPEIGSVEAFTHALLNAKTIAYVDPALGGASGVHFSQVLERLGLYKKLKSKIKLVTGSGAIVVGDVVARGDADIGIQQISEILPVPGVDLVGPLPLELQKFIEFSAAVVAVARAPSAARDLIEFFKAEPALAAIRANGMEPG